MLFSVFGGMYPGAAFTLAARFAAKPSHMAMMAGLLMQGAAIGQVTDKIAKHIYRNYTSRQPCSQRKRHPMLIDQQGGQKAGEWNKHAGVGEETRANQ